MSKSTTWTLWRLYLSQDSLIIITITSHLHHLIAINNKLIGWGQVWTHLKEVSDHLLQQTCFSLDTWQLTVFKISQQQFPSGQAKSKIMMLKLESSVLWEGLNLKWLIVDKIPLKKLVCTLLMQVKVSIIMDLHHLTIRGKTIMIYRLFRVLHQLHLLEVKVLLNWN